MALRSTDFKNATRASPRLAHALSLPANPRHGDRLQRLRSPFTVGRSCPKPIFLNSAAFVVVRDLEYRVAMLARKIERHFAGTERDAVIEDPRRPRVIFPGDAGGKSLQCHRQLAAIGDAAGTAKRTIQVAHQGLEQCGRHRRRLQLPKFMGFHSAALPTRCLVVSSTGTSPDAHRTV